MQIQFWQNMSRGRLYRQGFYKLENMFKIGHRRTINLNVIENQHRTLLDQEQIRKVKMYDDEKTRGKERKKPDEKSALFLIYQLFPLRKKGSLFQH